MIIEEMVVTLYRDEDGKGACLVKGHHDSKKMYYVTKGKHWDAINMKASEIIMDTADGDNVKKWLGGTWQGCRKGKFLELNIKETRTIEKVERDENEVQEAPDV